MDNLVARVYLNVFTTHDTCGTDTNGKCVSCSRLPKFATLMLFSGLHNCRGTRGTDTNGNRVFATDLAHYRMRKRRNWSVQ